MAWEENSRICLHMQLIAILSRTGVVFSNLFHYLFRTRAAISSETIDSKSVLFKSLKEPLQRVLLMETKVFVKPNEQSQACLNSAMARKRATKWNICVAVAVLNADNQVANNRHARAITKELLVCRLRIILLSLYELVVEEIGRAHV